MKEHKETLSISFIQENEDEKNPDESSHLSIELVLFELNDIRKIQNLSIRKENDLLIKFVKGSSKIEMIFNTLLDEYYYNLDEKELEDTIKQTLLSNEFASFKNGLINIKLKKYRKQKYIIELSLENSGVYVKLAYKNNIVWEGRREILDLIVKEISNKTKLNERLQFHTKLLKTHNKVIINKNHKDFQIMDIKDMADAVQYNLEYLKSVEMKSESIENYQCNIISHNLITNHSELNMITIRPFGELGTKKYLVLYPEDAITPTLSERNYLVADVIISYKDGGKNIKKIEISKVHICEVMEDKFTKPNNPVDELNNILK